MRSVRPGNIIHITKFLSTGWDGMPLVFKVKLRIYPAVGFWNSFFPHNSGLQSYVRLPGRVPGSLILYHHSYTKLLLYLCGEGFCCLVFPPFNLILYQFNNQSMIQYKLAMALRLYNQWYNRLLSLVPFHFHLYYYYYYFSIGTNSVSDNI